jgi:hypothetical protein
VGQPLEWKIFLERRKEAAARYSASIGQFDRLVPWGAGGALVLSITFLEKIAPHPRLSTRWILLASWGGLTLALFASMWSHYTSSRIFSWRVNLLDHGQLLDKAKDKADWKRTYERIQRRIRLWGVLTASLNIVAGWSLILGITLMAVFAVANEPFVQQGP